MSVMHKESAELDAKKRADEQAKKRADDEEERRRAWSLKTFEPFVNLGNEKAEFLRIDDTEPPKILDIPDFVKLTLEYAAKHKYVLGIIFSKNSDFRVQIFKK